MLASHRYNTEATPTARVLVVDDDPLQCGEIGDFLRRRGVDVISADNGFAAYHEIRHARPAVVVMDMKMPGLDGIHISRLVGKLDVRPKVILMSGYPDYVYKAHQADTDIFAVIEKPVPLAALSRFIDQALKSLQS